MSGPSHGSKPADQVAAVLTVIVSPDTLADRVIPLLTGCSLTVVREISQVADLIARHPFHVAILPHETALLGKVKSLDPRVEVVLIGDDPSDAVEAVSAGAYAYLTPPALPFTLSDVMAALVDLVAIRQETAELERLLREKYTVAGIIGKNPRMLDLVGFVSHIAPYFRTVTVCGETGSGKEVVAKALHSLSPAAKHPFLVCNCGALVENLIESELFGHVKGSFTGAVNDKPGLFEAAGEGTVFLDEIGELPLSFQPHLLRVLESGEFRRVGSTHNGRARCRVIAATNRDMEQLVADGKFREDLFYRLNRLTLTVPPLRERPDDIPLLSRHLLERFAVRSGKKVLGISRPAQAALLGYHWPGNVRELENVIEEAAILTTESFVRLEDLPKVIVSRAAAREPLMDTLEAVEKKHVSAVLRECGGNRTRAAAVLGISRRSLIRRIEKLRI